MASRDLRGAQTVSPGDGNTLLLPVDRNGNIYPNDVYYYDAGGTRQSMVTQIASGGGGTAVTAASTFANQQIPVSTGTGRAVAGYSGLTFNSGTSTLATTNVTALSAVTCNSVNASIGSFSGNLAAGTLNSVAYPSSVVLGDAGKVLQASAANTTALTSYTLPTTLAASDVGKSLVVSGTGAVTPAFAGSTPLFIRPLAYSAKTLPSGPWTNSVASTELAYTGTTPERFAMIIPFGSSLAGASQGVVSYNIKNVSGSVSINFSCLLSNWSTNGGGAYPAGIRLRLQHTNASSTTVDLATITGVGADTFYTDDRSATATPTTHIAATFTGNDTLSVRIDGGSSTGAFTAYIQGITVY